MLLQPTGGASQQSCSPVYQINESVKLMRVERSEKGKNELGEVSVASFGTLKLGYASFRTSKIS